MLSGSINPKFAAQSDPPSILPARLIVPHLTIRAPENHDDNASMEVATRFWVAPPASGVSGTIERPDTWTFDVWKTYSADLFASAPFARPKTQDITKIAVIARKIKTIPTNEFISPA